MTVERFNAEVGAEIKDFQREMRRVDKQIRELATGVDVDIRANTKDFTKDIKAVEKAVKELDGENVTIDLKSNVQDVIADISRVQIMTEALDAKNASVKINAMIRDFLTDIAVVQAKINQLDSNYVTVEIRASINDFMRDMLQVKALTQELDKQVVDIKVKLNDNILDDILKILYELEALGKEKVDIKITLNLAVFYTQIQMVHAELTALSRASVDIKVDINSNSITAEIARIQVMLATINNPNVRINTNSISAVRQLNSVNRTANNIKRNIFIKIWVDYTRAMQAYAVTVRAFAEAGQQMLSGAFISLIPILSQLFSVLVGLVGSLGVMIGVLAGQFMVLASALTFALAGFVALGAVAIPTIKNLFDETAKLTAEQQKARGAWDGFVKVYDDMVKKTEGAVLQAFTSAMEGATKILTALEPMILKVADSAAVLMESFNKSIDSAPIQNILDTFNKFGPEIFTNMTSAIGKLVAGLLSLLSEFAPAAATWSAGFDDMMSSFLAWSDGLSNSEGFKTFIEYIQTYMPVISEIFANLIVGIVEFFSAFSTMGGDFMTSLAEMTGRFREWAAALGENQEFQQFLAFIKASTPAVLALLGNLWNLLINLLTALAPVGAVVLDLTNSFLAWFNAKLETNKVLAMLVALLPVVFGVISALVPIVISVISIFGNLAAAFLRILPPANTVMSVVYRVMGVLMNAGGIFTKFGGIILNLASRILPMLGSALGILSGPIGMIIGIVVTLGIVIYKNWDTILAYTKKTWGAISDFFTQTIPNIYNTVVSWFGDMWTAIVGFMEDILTSIEGGWNSAISYLEGISLAEIGKNIIQGLISGITGAFDGVKKKIAELGDLIPDWLKERLGIKSPSRVMAAIAKWIPAGIAKGITDNINLVKTASSKMSDAVTLDFTKEVDKSSSVFKNLMNVVTKTVKETAKKQQGERYEALEKSLSDHKKWTDLTLEQEYAYWQQALKHLKDGTGAKNKAQKNANDIQKQLLQEQFNNEINFIDQAREYGVLSLAEQIKAYEEYVKQYKVGTEQQVAYEEKLYTAKKALYESLQSIAKNYLSEVESIYQKLADEEKKLRDQYQQTYEARKETLANTWGLFDEVKLTEMTTYKEDGSVDKQIDLIGNMRQQVSTLSNWMNDIFRLQSFGLDEALIKEFQDLGPKAAAEINALASMSSQQLGEYEMLWKAKMELAGAQATSELAGAREDMEAEIVKLRENAVKDLEKLKVDMLKEVDEMVNGSTDQFNVLEATLPEIGKRAIQGLIDGIKSQSGQLKSTVQGIANDISREMSGILSGERFNASSSFTPAITSSSTMKVNSSSYNNVEMERPVVNLHLNSEWTGQEVKYWLDDQDATDTKSLFKRRG